MALDYQTLLSNKDVAGYRAFARPTMAQLLKLSLLRSIVITQNPMAVTDYQSLLSLTNVPGYRASAAASEVQLLELALLSLIANGSGAGGSISFDNYGGGQPSTSPSSNSINLDPSTGAIWAYNSKTLTWTEFLA